MKSSSLLLGLSTLVIGLSACGTTNTQDTPRHQVTYQIVRTNENKDISADTIKSELEHRLQALGSKDSHVSVDGDHLTADVAFAEFDRGKALDIGTPKQAFLEEPRTTFTSEEAERVKKFNQYQKDLVKKAHDQAVASPENIDAIVLQTSDENDLVNKGRHGPLDQGTINEPKVWQALMQTPVNGITPVVELSYVVWFAKVLDIRDDGGNKVVYYQQVSRNLKETGPYLNYVTVLNLSGHITKVTVVKKHPDDKNDNKDYTVHATLDAQAQQQLHDLSKQYLNKTVRLFIEDFPYTNITFHQEWTGPDLILDEDYTELNTKDISDRLNQGSLSAPLTLIAAE